MSEEESNAWTEKVRRGREGEGERKKDIEKWWLRNCREERGESVRLGLGRREVRVRRWIEVRGVWRRRSLDIFVEGFFKFLCASLPGVKGGANQSSGAEEPKEQEKKKRVQFRPRHRYINRHRVIPLCLHLITPFHENIFSAMA